MSDIYALPKFYRDSSKENIPKAFPSHQQLENESDNIFSKPTVDTQTVDLQIKSIMVQLIPYVFLCL